MNIFDIGQGTIIIHCIAARDTISIKDNIFFFILFLPFSDRFYPD